MSSIVLDLQNEITKPDCDTVNVLRKAHLIASKLQLSEFDSWIQNELKGYSYKATDEIPNYRSVKGVLKAFNPYQGWIPAMCPNNEIEKKICERKIWQSIGELQELYNQSQSSGTVLFQFPAEQMEVIASLFDTPLPMQYALHISVHLIKEIIEQTKNCLLEWTIKLEAEGIIGENMQFNAIEKERAQGIPQTINNFYGNANVINSAVDHSAIIVGDGNTIHFTYEAADRAVSEIESSIEKENLSNDDKETVMEMLAEIKDKISQEKKPNIIKAALSGLKDFLIGIGASATVAVIQAKMRGLF